MEQQNLLRQIRDEIRGSRQEAGGPNMSASQAMGPSRPSNSFVRAQLGADKFVSDKWDGLFWSNAYRSEIRGGMFMNAAGMLGIAPPPNTLGQAEYQAFAQESLGMSGRNIVGNIFGAGSMGTANQLGDELRRISMRGIRAGSSGAGILGLGMNRSMAQQLGMQIQGEVAGNLRLGSQDAVDILRAGGSSGQFDLEGSTGSIVSRFRELATATSDLTRITRMSVQEVSQVMGTLRQMGMADVGAQSAMVQQINASARVAGLSFGEMAGAAMQTAEMGRGFGFGAAPSMTLATNTLAGLRGMSQAGILSPEMVAAGGGLQNIQQSINQAQMRFLGSGAGRFAMMGGLGAGQGDVYQAMVSGLAGTGGTISGIFGAQRSMYSTMQGMSGDQLNRAFSQNIGSQLRLMGIDADSDEARDAAFGLVRGQMGDAAAYAFSESNFTGAGRRSGALSSMMVFDEAARRQRENEYSRYYEQSSFRGGLRRTAAAARAGLVGFRNRVTNFFSSDDLMGVGDTQFERQASLINMGVGVDSASIESMAQAMTATTSSNPAAIQLYQRGSAGAAAGSVFGGIGGGVLGWKAGAAAGAAIGSFLPGAGTAIGGIAGGLAGAYLGMEGGQFIGGLAGGSFDQVNTATLRGQSATDYLRVVNGLKSNTGMDRAKDLIQTSAGSKLFRNAKFVNLMNKMDRSGMSVKDSAQFSKDVSEIAQNTGESVETIVAAAKASGMKIDMASAFGKFGSKEEVDQSINNLLKGSEFDAGDFNFATSESAGALADLLAAYSSGDAQGIAQGQLTLSGLGMEGGKSFDMLKSRFSGMGASDQRNLIAALESREKSGASQLVNQRLDSAARFAGSLIEGNTGLSKAQQTTALEQLRGTTGDRREFLRLLGGKGGEGAALRQALLASDQGGLFRTAMDIGGADIGSMGAMQIAQQFEGISFDTASQVKSLMREGKITEQQASAFLQQQVLDPTNVEERGGYDEDAKVATLLNNASTTLKGVADRLKISLPE